MDLTIRWVDKVLNSTMARVLLRILGKLAQALEQGMARVLTVGRAIAFKASELAVGWGNGQAYAWRFDKAFWRGLGTVSTPSHHKEDRPDNKKSPMSSVRNVSSVM